MKIYKLLGLVTLALACASASPLNVGGDRSISHVSKILHHVRTIPHLRNKIEVADTSSTGSAGSGSAADNSTSGSGNGTGTASSGNGTSPVSLCTPNPCGVHGQCIDLIISDVPLFVCQCDSGWSGILCSDNTPANEDWKKIVVLVAIILGGVGGSALFYKKLLQPWCFPGAGVGAGVGSGTGSDGDVQLSSAPPSADQQATLRSEIGNALV